MSHRFPLTLTQLTYFVECARTLNMTAASQELHVAQSAVSTAITHLERVLGTTLFIRQHSKGLILTPAGEQLLRRSQRLFASLSDTIESIQAEQQSIRGTIHVACFHTLAPFLLPDLIRELAAAHPELDVEVHEGDYEQNLALLRSGKAEIAIGYTLAEEDDLRREDLGSIQAHVLLPKDHRLARARAIDLADLAAEPFVLLDLPGSREYFLGILLQAGIAPRIRHRTTSYETVRSMVGSGLGYSILNQRPRVDKTYSGQPVVTVPLKQTAAPLRVSVSSLAQGDLSGRARAVISLARRVLDESPATDQS